MLVARAGGGERLLGRGPDPCHHLHRWPGVRPPHHRAADPPGDERHSAAAGRRPRRVGDRARLRRLRPRGAGAAAPGCERAAAPLGRSSRAVPRGHPFRFRERARDLSRPAALPARRRRRRPVAARHDRLPGGGGGALLPREHLGGEPRAPLPDHGGVPAQRGVVAGTLHPDARWTGSAPEQRGAGRLRDRGARLGGDPSPRGESVEGLDDVGGGAGRGSSAAAPERHAGARRRGGNRCRGRLFPRYRPGLPASRTAFGSTG